MITAKKTYLIISIIFPFIAFYIILWLYNIWFDTWDKIKYDPTYSPGFDQNKTTENIVYWAVIVLSILIEIFLIKKYKSFKV